MDALVNGQPVQQLVQWFTVLGQHRQTISFTPAQSFAVGELSDSDPVYYMLIRDGPFHSSTEDPLFKDYAETLKRYAKEIEMNHAFLHVGKDDVETSQVSCCYIAI